MSVNRITGMMSGMDTDQMVKDLMKVEQSRIDNVKQNQQYSVWEQELYRDMINSIRSFKDTYFDVLKPETNITSASMFSQFSSSVEVAGESVSYVSVTGTSSINSYEHTITQIDQLATKDTWTTDALEIGVIDSDTLDFGSIPASLEFSLTIEGVTKTISIADTSGIADTADLTTALNTEIQNQFGADYSSVVSTDGSKITFRKDGSDITILQTSGHSSDMSWLGITSGEATTDYQSKSLNDLFGITDADLATMTINDVALSDLDLTEDSGLSDLTSAISSSDASANLVYNTLSDSFELTADTEGSANDLDLSADFISKLGFVDDVTHHTSGQNAQLTLDGVSITKSTNTFTMDGVQYSLKNTYDGASGDIDISVDLDTSTVVDNVKSFIEDYNDLIKGIHEKLDEKKNYDYKPLTDEEKEALSDDEVEKWEEKAKSGLLRGSSELESLVGRMRTALYESVEGAGVTLSEIGITTSTDYKDNGKLLLDEDKLTEALENNFEEVVDLFTKESDKDYLDDDNATERYEENGIGFRLFDIVQDSIRTTRNDNGKKGTLLEKAGIDGDLSDFQNTLTTEILDYETRIGDLLADMYDKENDYYNMFARMESALAQMEAQAGSLLSQLGM